MDITFRSLAEALRRGFTIYDRTEDGYLVRRRAMNGLWELAMVVVANERGE